MPATHQTKATYTEAKVDVTKEIEQRAQQAAQAGADHCALCSISCVTSTLAMVYFIVQTLHFTQCDYF